MFEGKCFEFFYVYKCTNQRKITFHTIMNMPRKRDDQRYYFLITVMSILIALLPSEVEINCCFSTLYAYSTGNVVVIVDSII
jgi:hypothetical protein